MKAYTLPNFNGPIELLLYLVQKQELDVGSIPLREITRQFLDDRPDEISPGAEFLANAASLLQMKSARLLPGEERIVEEERSLDALFEIADYCRLTELAESLEEQGDLKFTRPPVEVEEERKLESVPAEELAQMLEELLLKVAKRAPKTVDDEEWRVADGVQLLRKAIPVRFNELFVEERPRGELIALFLALLELMKGQEVRVVRHTDTIEIVKYE